MKAVQWVGGVYGGKDLWKRYVLSLKWKRVGVMYGVSDDDGRDEFRWLGWEEWERDLDPVDEIKQEVGMILANDATHLNDIMNIK